MEKFVCFRIVKLIFLIMFQNEIYDLYLRTLYTTVSEANKFLSDMISLHNTARALHNADGLEWDLQVSYNICI